MKHQIAEVQISYMPNKMKGNMKVTCSSDAARIARASWDPGTLNLLETFKVLLMNNSNEALGILTLGQGTMTSCLVDIKVLMGVVLKSAACSIVLIHNHPSGKKIASSNDEALTKRIIKACELFDVRVLDHIILTESGYFSFSDGGIM